MSDELTPWFPPHIKPVHVGVYETASATAEGNPLDGSEGFQRWDGRVWGGFKASACEAYVEDGYVSKFQNNCWRGLAEQPK